MRAKTLILCLALLLIGAGTSLAQPHTGSDLLLPYFEVGLGAPQTTTTVFAVGNWSRQPAWVEMAVHSNWGIPILPVYRLLGPNEVFTANLYDWIVLGQMPDPNGGTPIMLPSIWVTYLQATLTGQRFPHNGYYYSTPVLPGTAVGYVRIRALGSPRAELWGDYMVTDLTSNMAAGDQLVTLDSPAMRLLPANLCRRHAVRFLNGPIGGPGGPPSASVIVVWSDLYHAPSRTQIVPSLVTANLACFDEAGTFENGFQRPLLAVERIDVAALGIVAPFGWLDVTTSADTLVLADHVVPGQMSVGLRAWCK